MKKIIYSLLTSLIVSLSFISVALAAPATITDFVGTATYNSVYLTWVQSGNNTLIRYSTTTYPATIADGILAYNGTSSYALVEGLTAGATYYFSAWGFDGNYSATAAPLVINTLPSSSENTTLPFNKPTMPTQEDPDSSGWSIYPLDIVIDYFSDNTSSHGGLGTQSDNVIMFIAGFIVTGISIGSYIKWRSFFGALAVALVLSSGASLIGAMQWIVPVMLLAVGFAVAAVNRALE